MEMNADQKKALKLLKGSGNVFLTGAAGSGKSVLIRYFLKDLPSKTFPTLASTGAAAILVGGRTFHSFFGLGIMEKGIQATYERAITNQAIIKRIKKVHGVIIDEVSMLSGPVLRTAEMIARKIRENTSPWGGIRVIAVGDFAQLPPVNLFKRQREWAFLDEVWEMSEFQPAILNQVIRTQDSTFLHILNQVRIGNISPNVKSFLTSRSVLPPSDFKGTRLFARREDVDRYNLNRLGEIDSKAYNFETIYTGKSQEIEKFKKHSPIGDSITLKEGALVMLRQNDPEGKWVNGSLGSIEKITDSELTLLLTSQREVHIKPCDFTLLNSEGDPAVTARNFPISLAWALTIHKAQGTTLDQMVADLRGLWEPGQAYVALSRARTPQGLFLDGWTPSSLKSDPLVHQFHQSLLFSD